jgi:hypothetical protein
MIYLDKLLGYLDKLQLTFTQWAMLAMAVTIGALVGLLRLQGSRLHRLQVQVLEEHVRTISSQDDTAVQEARSRFNKALQDYRSAVDG